MSPETGHPDTTPTHPGAAICPVCHGQFMPNPRQIYCSPRCKVLARRTTPAAPQAHLCPVCEGEFTANPRLRQVYCSPACRRTAEKQRDFARDEARARRLGETPPRLPDLPPPPKPVARSGPRQITAERDPLEPTATRNCPHCDEPITIVALLATPEAARPALPTRLPDITPIRRTP